MTLYLKVISAQLTRDTDWFSKMDPYCQVKLGNVTKKTKTINGGGKEPVWNQLMVFQNVKSFDMKIVVKDEDPGRDDQVGSTQISLQKYAQETKQHNEQILLQFNKKPAGRLKVNIYFKSDLANNQGEGSYNSGNNFNQSGQYGGVSSGFPDFSQNFNNAANQLSFFGGSGSGSFNQGPGGFTLKPAMNNQGDAGWQKPPQQNNSWGPNNNGWGQGNQNQGNQSQGNQSPGSQGQGSNSGW